MITFHEEPLTQAELLSEYRLVRSQGLPYLVAVDPSTAAILGYANAHPFRSRAAYRFSVELSLFCHPDHAGKGIGGRLLETLVDVMKQPAKYSELLALPPGQEPREVKQALAVMSVDEMGKRNGLALKEFYEKHGFELRAHLKGIGYKFGRWYVPGRPVLERLTPHGVPG